MVSASSGTATSSAMRPQAGPMARACRPPKVEESISTWSGAAADATAAIANPTNQIPKVIFERIADPLFFFLIAMGAAAVARRLPHQRTAGARSQHPAPALRDRHGETLSAPARASSVGLRRGGRLGSRLGHGEEPRFQLRVDLDLLEGQGLALRLTLRLHLECEGKGDPLIELLVVADRLLDLHLLTADVVLGLLLDLQVGVGVEID